MSHIGFHPEPRRRALLSSAPRILTLQGQTALTQHKKSLQEQTVEQDMPALDMFRRDKAVRSPQSYDSYASERSANLSIRLEDGTALPPPDIKKRYTPFNANSITRIISNNAPLDHHSDTTHDSHDQRSLLGSRGTSDTQATSIHTLPALQTKGPVIEVDHLEPLEEDDPRSFNLVAPAEDIPASVYEIETRADQMFSKEHLHYVFADPALLLSFTSFLSVRRPQSVPLLIYYLDALKALRAIKYANAVSEALEPLGEHIFTMEKPEATQNKALEEKIDKAFGALVQEDLPAYITEVFIKVVSLSIQRRICGTLPPHLREASEGLAEVFCLTDPSRPDNPIVFASEEFHRTTQYGVNYAIGRNCRFLQGPRTNPFSAKRLKRAINEGRDHCETFINYRRDGSPFMNLLMVAPLKDSRGTLRYFIGAQIDVSGLVKEGANLEALQTMLAEQSDGKFAEKKKMEKKDVFQELSEMFNMAELDTVRKYGGHMHREHVEENDDSSSTWHRPRLLLKDQNGEMSRPKELNKDIHGKLSGVYQHYLLVRPYPSLRILFTSPSLRIPGILQSPFMNRIGSSVRVREELTSALAEGRSVTAKIRWLSRSDDEGRSRWIHCTPLFGQTGQIGVWMIVLVDDEHSTTIRQFREAPPIPTRLDKALGLDGRERRALLLQNDSLTSIHAPLADGPERTLSFSQADMDPDDSRSLPQFVFDTP